jgi:hypothetical protein
MNREERAALCGCEGEDAVAGCFKALEFLSLLALKLKIKVWSRASLNVNPSSIRDLHQSKQRSVTTTSIMVINPTYLAQRTRQCESALRGRGVPARANCESVAVNWSDAKRRVLGSYREWIRSVCCLISRCAYRSF